MEEELERRVSNLLSLVDKLKAQIESHEFSLAADTAITIELNSESTNRFANSLADKED